MLGRRSLLAAPVLASLLPRAWALPAAALRFPRDAGAHNDYAIEWWYITGFANARGQTAAFGYQVTFFRSRVPGTQSMQSRLAARQLLFAHAAVTDVQGKTLWHDQRIARWSGEALGANPADIAAASLRDTDIVLRDWSLRRVGEDLQAHIPAGDFQLDLNFKATQTPVLQGQQGLSRKGPDTAQASYYYSLPQLQATGSIALKNQRHPLESGSNAWLDHEWSQQVLHPLAVGWDWIGINLLDGGALTAFQLRDAAGRALWDGGSLRTATGALRTFSRGEVTFQALRRWQSSLSQTHYPVEWTVRTPTDVYTIKAVVDNQELDSRNSTGSIYWEGLSDVRDQSGKLVGRGYLEMTGYAAPLTM